jgi:primosomal protein N' (replication factor Y)
MTEPGQMALLRSTARRARSVSPRPAPVPARDRPVARVAVDVGLAHLDRPFDYLVPEELDDQAVPGARVRVRFAGRLVGGFVLERAEASEHGRLAFLQKVVSAEPVLGAGLHRLAREVATHYAGSVSDVLRLAVPPRHARTEAAPSPEPAPDPPRPPGDAWDRYTHGRALLDAVSAGSAPRAVWGALPGPGWPGEVADLVVTALAAGRGALVVLPDHRDVDRVDAALRERVGEGHHVVLTAEAGPAARYRRWLAVSRGAVRAVVGTRAAMFAPVTDLGLAVVWDDGDDLHAEPRAPYPHVRTVLALRSRLQGAALVLGGLSRTAEGAALVRSGWAQEVAAPREVVRVVAPSVRPGGDDARDAGGPGARLPTLAWRTVAQGLEQGPVLVQVPRAGYVPGLACATCRGPARCAACGGPLGSPSGTRALACRWCGVTAAAWACPTCGGARLRATAVGSARTAEELGRAFPRTTVRGSGGSVPVLASVGREPALVVATPGAEPVADGGYAAALLLDGTSMLSRPDLPAAEEALRRWSAAAALVRPAPEGGRVVVVADSAHRAVQALVRWDPATFADRELAERAELRLPPDVRMVSVTGEPEPVHRFLAAADLPGSAEVLGPVPAADGLERVLVRAPLREGREVVAALRAAAGVRSAHKDPGSVRVQVDPLDIA